MSRRYLTLEEAARALASGRSVEQWLGAEQGSTISWVDCTMTRDHSFRVTLYRALDVGTDTFLDVYAFPLADDDAPPVVASFGAPTSALEHAIRSLGADAGRFVNRGVIQDEYRDHRLRAVA